MSSLKIVIKNNLKKTRFCKGDGVKQTNRFCEFMNFYDISWKFLFLPKKLIKILTLVKLIPIPYYLFNNKLHV